MHIGTTAWSSFSWRVDVKLPLWGAGLTRYAHEGSLSIDNSTPYTGPARTNDASHNDIALGCPWAHPSVASLAASSDEEDCAARSSAALPPCKNASAP